MKLFKECGGTREARANQIITENLYRRQKLQHEVQIGELRPARQNRTTTAVRRLYSVCDICCLYCLYSYVFVWRVPSTAVCYIRSMSVFNLCRPIYTFYIYCWSFVLSFVPFSELSSERGLYYDWYSFVYMGCFYTVLSLVKR